MKASPPALQRFLLRRVLTVLFFANALFQVLQVHGQTWTYQASYQQQPVELDSILIENLSNGGFIVIADTVFNTSTVGILEPWAGSSELLLRPSYPNPFSGSTTFEVAIAQAGTAELEVYDALGRVIAQSRTVLSSGIHGFQFSHAQAGTYILRVRANGQQRTLRMVGTEDRASGQATLKHMGSLGNSISALYKDGSLFDWQPGETVRHTGFATLPCQVWVQDQITGTPPNADTTFHFIMSIPSGSEACLQASPLNEPFDLACVGDSTQVRWSRVQGYGLACGSINIGPLQHYRFGLDPSASLTSLVIDVNDGLVDDTLWIRFRPTSTVPPNTSLPLDCGEESIAITLNGTANSVGAPSANSPQSFCQTSNPTIADLLATGGAGASIRWYENMTGGEALEESASLAADTYYASQVLGECEGTARTSVVVTLSSPPTLATVGGDQTINANGTTNSLGGNPPDMGTGLWSVVSGGTGIFSDPSANNSTFTHSTGNSIVLRWTISNPPCDPSSDDLTVTVEGGVEPCVPPPDPPTAASPQNFCAGATVTDLGATGTPGANIVWYAATSGGSPLAPSTTLVNGTTYHAAQVVETCESVQRTAVTVIVNSLPTASITPAGNTTFCFGGSVTLTASGGTSYLWSTGATTATINATTGANYTVTVTNANGCTASASQLVTVNPLPTATITANGATTLCEGSSVQLNANTGAGLAYQWQRNGTNIAGATTSSYTATTPGSYTVVVSTSAGCSTASTPTNITLESGTCPTLSVAPILDINNLGDQCIGALPPIALNLSGSNLNAGELVTLSGTPGLQFSLFIGAPGAIQQVTVEPDGTLPSVIASVWVTFTQPGQFTGTITIGGAGALLQVPVNAIVTQPLAPEIIPITQPDVNTIELQAALDGPCNWDTFGFQVGYDGDTTSFSGIEAFNSFSALVGVEPGGTYSIRAFAGYGGNPLLYSPWTEYTSLPAPPENVVHTCNCFPSTSLNQVSWNGVFSALEYEVIIIDSGSADTVVEIVTSDTSLCLTPNYYAWGGSYAITVRARNVSGWGGGSTTTIFNAPGIETVQISASSAFLPGAIVQIGGGFSSGGCVKFYSSSTCRVCLDQELTEGCVNQTSTSSAPIFNFSNFQPGTEYHYDLCFNTNLGEICSTVQSFTTPVPPSVTTTEPYYITARRAMTGGLVTGAGSGSAITSLGICYSESPGPTVQSSIVIYADNVDPFASYLSYLEYLSPNTTYYVRAFATNDLNDTGYGEEFEFTTTASICPQSETYHGTDYPIIEINGRCWFRNNLNTDSYNDDEAITLQEADGPWNDPQGQGLRCYYEDNIDNVGNSGQLYNWYAVSSEKLCPAGWRVPTDEDWRDLEIYLGMSGSEALSNGWRGTIEQNIGGQMKATANEGGGIWASPNLGVTNESGFSAMPSGLRLNNGTYVNGPFAAGYSWTSTESAPPNVDDTAVIRMFGATDDNTYKVNRFDANKRYGSPARCIQIP